MHFSPTIIYKPRNKIRGNVTRGNEIQRNVTRRNEIQGNEIRGNMTRGNEIPGKHDMRKWNSRET
jgi:hypothetical protein